MNKIGERTPSDTPEPICLRASLAEDLGYLLARCWLDADRTNTAIERNAAVPRRGGVDRAGGTDVREVPGERPAAPMK